MASWWHRDVNAAGKLPLMLCFLAFVVTFVLTLTAACLGLALAGFSPFGVQDVERYRADSAADRDRDPHRRRRARLDLRAEGQVPDGTVRALAATRRGDRRSAPRAPVIDLGTTSLPGQPPGTRDAPRRRHRPALGPTPGRLGRLRRRETVPAQPARQRRRPPLNPARVPKPTPGSLAGCVGRLHWQPVVDRRSRGLRSRVCLARPRLVCQPGWFREVRGSTGPPA